MSDIQLYLLEVDKNKPEAEEIAARSAARLQTKDLKLIDIITSLQEYINNKSDAGLRAKSVAYLADVLSALQPKVLTVQERRLLCDFILGRLEGDLEGVGASARALIALESLGKWDAPTAERVMRTVVNNTHPLRQFQTQTERFAIIQLVDLLLAKYRKAMQDLQHDDFEFMTGFVSYFEGEKDPRNLMIIFSLLQVPMTEWDVQANAQDMFDSVFNYFPITFKPPPDDPYGITAQDLKDRLRDCIAANSDFAPYAFPQLLDKLDSTSMNTKRDVLAAIQACIKGYESKTINLYSVTLWDALKFEILNPQEEDLAEESLRALALIGAKFANNEGPLNAYLRPIMKECNEHLEDAPTKQSEAAGRIIDALATAAPKVADKVTKGILPVLFSLYHSSESITKRRGLLEAFNRITSAYVELGTKHIELNTEAIQAFASDALEAMLRALISAPKAEVSFRLTSLKGLELLIGVRKALNEKEVDRAVDTVTDVVLHEQADGHGDIRPAAIEALTALAHSAPSTVRDRTVPAFMVELPDVPAEDDLPVAILEAFAQLSSERQVFDTVVLRLKNKLNAARQQDAPQTYQRALLLALLYAFTFGSPLHEDGVVRSSYYTEYAEPLVEDIRNKTGDAQTAQIVGRLCNVLLRTQGVHFQSTVYSKNADWLLPSVSNPKTTSTPFALYFFAALRPEIVEAEDVVKLLQAQSQIVSAPAQDNKNVEADLRLISLLINKFAAPKTMQTTVMSSNLDLDALLKPSPSTQTIAVAFAVLKALIIQGKASALTSSYLNSLLDLLASSTVSTTVAQHFGTLLTPDDILTKENHCTISGLYKQKIFGQAVPFLTSTVRTAEPAAKTNYLIALSGILRSLPYSILAPSLASLIPPLLQTLDLPAPSQTPKTAALTIFESVLMHDATLVTEHTSSLITRLLNCTTSPANGENVRARALRCLALVPKQLKAQSVVMYRRQVVKRLVGCLDDGKRGVRGEAVKCRTAWLGVDEGEEEEEE